MSDPDPAARAPSAVRPYFALPKTVALVGLMGVGKTTIGRRLADHFRLPFMDADEEIEKAAGQTVADIFTNYGEKGFRDGEQRVIARLLEGETKVLATGGGALTHPLTRDNLKARAITVWLKTDLKVIARRVANRSHRPLLKNKDPMEVLQEHVRTRYPLYAIADVVVDTGDQPHGRAVDMVVNAIKAYLDTLPTDTHS